MTYFKIFILLILVSCNSQRQNTNFNEVSETSSETDIEKKIEKYAIVQTIHGKIKIKLFNQLAPNTINRFETLVKQGFYDGLNFHRVIPNFIIQTGDPTNTGSGGSGQKLKPEFNNIQHTRGTVGMARLENDPDSADSQFYISLSTLSKLDGSYTVFGQVVGGDENLDKIVVGDKILSISIEDSHSQN